MTEVVIRTQWDRIKEEAMTFEGQNDKRNHYLKESVPDTKDY